MPEETLPNHIGFIIDGNRRWAKEHGLPAYEGHLAGYNAVIEVLTAALEAGVNFATVYAFSTENWKRSEDEVSRLMAMMLRILTTDLPIIQEKNVRLRVIGSRDKIDEKIIKAIDSAESKTAGNTGGTLAICWNYGGQLEVVDAVKKIVKSGVDTNDLTVEMISENLYSPELPPLDLIVRTSGEQRLSNFMLWRSVYSEIIFIKKYWPDMKKKDLKTIFSEYSKRARRFGV
jgi:undecaprenyl diphosphate synthase